MARILGKEVAAAAPYFWVTPLVDVIEAAAKTIPDYTFTAESFPTPRGYIWFQRPLVLHADPDPERRVVLTSLSWGVHTDAPEPDGGVAAYAWGYASHSARSAGLPSLSSVVTLGWTLRETNAWSDERPFATGADRDSLRTAISHRFQACLAACLSFLEQRIVVASAAQVARATRRRMERQAPAHEPIVRVVELRRRAAEHGERVAADDPEAANWQHRWVVSGHWRRQYYPSSEAHKPVYIHPYVKGPEDRPLKPPATTVYAVRR